MSIRDEKIVISKEQYKDVIDKCKSINFNQQQLLLQCAVEARSDISLYIYESITTGKSWDKFFCENEVPLNRKDFYIARKKCIALFAERTRIKC